MRAVRILCLAIVTLVLAMPAAGQEDQEPSYEQILFGSDLNPAMENEAAGAAEIEAPPAEPIEIEYVTSSGEAPPVAFYLTTRCGGWSYAGCCGSQRKYRRSCYIVELPWETWTETKCQNTCVL